MNTFVGVGNGLLIEAHVGVLLWALVRLVTL